VATSSVAPTETEWPSLFEWSQFDVHFREGIESWSIIYVNLSARSLDYVEAVPNRSRANAIGSCEAVLLFHSYGYRLKRRSMIEGCAGGHWKSRWSAGAIHRREIGVLNEDRPDRYLPIVLVGNSIFLATDIESGDAPALCERSVA
jgi:hypothetical protein